MMLLQQTEKVQLVKCVARRGNFQNTAAWKKLSCWIFFFLQNSLLKKSSAPKAARSDLTPPPLPHTDLSKHNCNIQISAAGWLLTVSLSRCRSYLMEVVTRTGAPGVVQCVGSQRGHTTVAWLSEVQLGWTSEESHRRLAAVCCG